MDLTIIKQRSKIQIEKNDTDKGANKIHNGWFSCSMYSLLKQQSGGKSLNKYLQTADYFHPEDLEIIKTGGIPVFTGVIWFCHLYWLGENKWNIFLLLKWEILQEKGFLLERLQDSLRASSRCELILSEAFHSYVCEKNTSSLWPWCRWNSTSCVTGAPHSHLKSLVPLRRGYGAAWSVWRYSDGHFFSWLHPLLSFLEN